MLWLS